MWAPAPLPPSPRRTASADPDQAGVGGRSADRPRRPDRPVPGRRGSSESSEPAGARVRRPGGRPSAARRRVRRTDDRLAGEDPRGRHRPGHPARRRARPVRNHPSSGEGRPRAWGRARSGQRAPPPGRPNTPHPHVRDDRLCPGDAAEPIAAALREAGWPARSWSPGPSSRPTPRGPRTHPSKRETAAPVRSAAGAWCRTTGSPRASSRRPTTPSSTKFPRRRWRPDRPAAGYTLVVMTHRFHRHDLPTERAGVRMASRFMRATKPISVLAWGTL